MNRLPLSFYLQVLLCATLWGSAFPVIKISFQELNLTTYGEQLIFAGTRFLLAGLMILPFCRRHVIQNIRSAPKWKLFAIVMGQTYFQYLFFYYGLRVSSGTLGALLVSTGSFWWIILAPIILKTPAPRLIHWVLIALCSIGIAFAVYAPGAENGNVGLGAIAFLCATLSGAVAAIFMKEVLPISGSRSTTSFSLTVGGILLLLTATPHWSLYFSHFSITTFLVTLYLAALSAIAFTIWNRLIKHYSINTLSTFRFLIPLFGVIESALFIPNEHIGTGIMIGGSIILLCIIAISRIPQES